MKSTSETNDTDSISVFDGAIQIRICTGKTQSNQQQYSVYEICCQPGSGPPLHIHDDVDEAFYVFEGEFQFQIGEERVIAPTGWFGEGPRNIKHTFAASSATPAKLLMVVSPAGLEDFFVGLGELTSAESADMETVTAHFEKHGMTIVGPPLATGV